MSYFRTDPAILACESETAAQVTRSGLEANALISHVHHSQAFRYHNRTSFPLKIPHYMLNEQLHKLSVGSDTFCWVASEQEGIVRDLSLFE